MSRYALLIGISEYRDPNIGFLKKSISDVAALERILSDRERGGFTVTKLIDCTKGEAERAISTLTQKRVHGETILVYFSGHGIRDDDGNLYLAVADSDCEDLWATALFAPALCFKLDKSLADQQLVILDCCHSGSFSPGAKTMIGDSVGTQQIFIREGKGRIVLTASDATSFAWETGSNASLTDESVFTHHMVRGIESGDADLEGDARIDADELYRYVYREVVRERPDQHPMKFGHAQEGKLIVSLAPVKVRPLPEAVVAAINNPIKGVRAVVIEILEKTVQQGNPGERIAAYAALRNLARDDSREVSTNATAALKRNAAPVGFVEEQNAEEASAPVPADAVLAPQPAFVPGTPSAADLPAHSVLPVSDPAPRVALAAAEATGSLTIAGRAQDAAPAADTGDDDSDASGPLQLLNPSLLDRLIDNDPARSLEYQPSEATIRHQSIHGLHRDIHHLLNTVSPLGDALAEFPALQASVVNYGLTEIQSFERYSPGGRHRIARRIQEALRRFEPRLARVVVTPVVDIPAPSEPRFRIEGSVLTDKGDGPLPTVIAFTVDFDSSSATLKIIV